MSKKKKLIKRKKSIFKGLTRRDSWVTDSSAVKHMFHKYLPTNKNKTWTSRVSPDAQTNLRGCKTELYCCNYSNHKKEGMKEKRFVALRLSSPPALMTGSSWLDALRSFSVQTQESGDAVKFLGEKLNLLLVNQLTAKFTRWVDISCSLHLDTSEQGDKVKPSGVWYSSNLQQLGCSHLFSCFFVVGKLLHK